MLNKRLLAVFLSIVFGVTGLASAQAVDDVKRTCDGTNHLAPARLKSATYAFDASPPTSVDLRRSLGSVAYSSSAESPGVTIGGTWYEYQHNGSMGRMIETGPHSGETGYTAVHMGWMYLPDKQSLGSYRSYAYSAYRSEDHVLLAPVVVMNEGEDYGGYVNVDVTPDNRAIVGGRPSGRARQHAQRQKRSNQRPGPRPTHSHVPSRA